MKSKEKMNEYAKISQDTDSLMEKLKLNFALMIKMKRGQDEVTDDLFMEKEEKPEEQIIENDVDENIEPGEDEQGDNIIPEEEIEEVPINQEEIDQRREEEQMQEFLKRSSGVPVENSMLIDREKIMELNDELQKYYRMKIYIQEKRNINDRKRKY